MDEQISDLELKILTKLYDTYRKTGEIVNWKCLDAFKELKLKEGSYIGQVNSSRFIETKVVGTHEHWRINDNGIRYMDSISRTPTNKKKLGKKKIEDGEVWAQLSIEEQDDHIIIGTKDGDKKVHMIRDKKVGEFRFDKNDTSPHELVEAVTTEIKLKSGKAIKVTKNDISFTDADDKTNFQLQYVVRKISFDKEMEYAKNEIERVKSILSSEKFEGNQVLSDLIANMNPLFYQATKEDYISYIVELDKYYENYKKLSASSYFVNIILDSNQYDSKISVEVKLEGAAKFVATHDLEEEKPNKVDDRRDYLSNIANISMRGITPMNQPAYRTEIIEKPKLLACTLSYLKVDQHQPIFNDGNIVVTDDKKLKLDIKINSEKSKGDINYQKELDLSEVKDELSFAELLED